VELNCASYRETGTIPSEKVVRKFKSSSIPCERRSGIRWNPFSSEDQPRGRSGTSPPLPPRSSLFTSLCGIIPPRFHARDSIRDLMCMAENSRACPPQGRKIVLMHQGRMCLALRAAYSREADLTWDRLAMARKSILSRQVRQPSRMSVRAHEWLPLSLAFPQHVSANSSRKEISV